MKYAPLMLLAGLAFLFFYFDLYHYLQLKQLRTYQEVALHWTNTHYAAGVMLYIVCYVLMIACAIPCATLLTLLGGFLFGVPALLYAVFSTTLGGVILFLATRSALGSRMASKTSGWVQRLERGFKRNAFNYILLLRLIPIMPCWVSNITAGVLNVPLMTFIGASVLGIIPATFIYVLAGRSLDKLLANDQIPISQLVFSPSILFPLMGLAFLAIFPVIYRSLSNKPGEK